MSDPMSDIPHTEWYQDDDAFEPDQAFLTFYKTYTGIEDDAKVEEILRRTRREAYKAVQFPTFGMWLHISALPFHHPQYETIIDRLRSGEKHLEMGCGLGQDSRFFLNAGAKVENLIACDLKKELIDIGFEIFGDKNRLPADFFQTYDVFSPEFLNAHRGKHNIISSFHFIHIFTFTDQVAILKILMQCLNTTSQSHPPTIWGTSVSFDKVEKNQKPDYGPNMTRPKPEFHNETSFKDMIVNDVLGEENRDQWTVTTWCTEGIKCHKVPDSVLQGRKVYDLWWVIQKVK